MIIDRIEFIEEGCWNVINRNPNKDGYYNIARHGRAYKAHRYLYEKITGHSLKDVQVLMHVCDNRRCVNPAHMREGNHTENNKDMVSKRRNNFGVKNGLAKVNEQIVQNIRKEKGSFTSIGKKYGIDHATVAAIIRRETWKHVPDSLSQPSDFVEKVSDGTPLCDAEQCVPASELSKAEDSTKDRGLLFSNKARDVKDAGETPPKYGNPLICMWCYCKDDSDKKCDCECHKKGEKK